MNVRKNDKRKELLSENKNIYMENAGILFNVGIFYMVEKKNYKMLNKREVDSQYDILTIIVVHRQHCFILKFIMIQLYE